MNYQQLETLTYDRQANFLAEAEQRRLANAVAPAQIHPLLSWIGQQFVALGTQLLRAEEMPALPVMPQAVAR